jgi:hypothetical protein
LNKNSFRGEKLMNKITRLIITVIVAAAVLLLALSCTTPTNRQPIISSLEAEMEWTIPSGSLKVICTASDPDGDELSYSWSASGGETNGKGATATWQAPHSEGSYDVTVTVTDGRGGEAMSHVTITVRADRLPIITSLITDANRTIPSGSLQVMCTASDPDGDELNYEWTATGGDISGTGFEVTWTAPEEVGTYDVTVVVKDGHGQEDTRSITLSVISGTPPIVEDLIVTAKGHKYLRKSMFGFDYDVWREQEYDIECIVADTGTDVSYEWLCTGGSISGEGSVITWTAPNHLQVAVTVMVIVSDVDDNNVSDSMVLYVPSCSCGF